MITSVQNAKIKMVAKLHQKKYRDETKQFIVEGEHLVIEAQKAHVVIDIYALEAMPRFSNAELVSEAVMKKMTNTKQAPKVIAICKQQFNQFLSDKVLILEHLQDPGNVGTLLRSALAFDFKTIVLDDCVDIFNPKVIRATQGALFQLSFLSMDVEAFNKKYPRYQLLVTAVDKTARHPRPIPPFALVLGNEGQGVKAATKKLSNQSVHIPTVNVESLNVAVAGSILMQALSNETIF